MNEYTIAIPDNDAFFRLRVTNDKNLRLIEEHFDVPVFTKENELSVENDNLEICQKFKFIADRAIDEIRLAPNFSYEDARGIVPAVLNIQKIDVNKKYWFYGTYGAVRREKSACKKSKGL